MTFGQCIYPCHQQPRGAHAITHSALESLLCQPWRGPEEEGSGKTSEEVASDLKEEQAVPAGQLGRESVPVSGPRELRGGGQCQWADPQGHQL